MCCRFDSQVIFKNYLSTAEPPGFKQPPIMIKSRYELTRIVTGLLANKKYRFTVLAATSVGASIDPNYVEVITSSAERNKSSKIKLIANKKKLIKLINYFRLI